ncbi:MAG: hypothetical protein JWO51_3370 [Rhodospirillales bacterium]|nr:hypothetical protein [Rhodospirillales bacterium]
MMPDPARIVGMARRRASVAAAVACLITSTAHAEDNPVVAAIEAAYLTKFAAFIEWPPGAPDALCVLASDAIGRLIEQAESKLPADAGPANVRRLQSESPAAECGVLFISDPDRDAAMPPMAPATLVVTDRAAEGRKGVINFVIRDDRVRFEIDDAEAARRGLTISSKLLSLAVFVKPRA